MNIDWFNPQLRGLKIDLWEVIEFYIILKKNIAQYVQS